MVPAVVGAERSVADRGGVEGQRRAISRFESYPPTVARELPASIHTVVIGAGHAGLIMSRLLRHAGREHVVIERRASLGGGWQDRWEAFQLVTPNFLTDLPDFPYDAGDPDGFMSRDEIAGRTARYAGVVDAPVVLETDVQRVTARDDGMPGFTVETSRGSIQAREVVGATGAFHRPRIPENGLDPGITQVHAHHYRNPDALPPGGVLVVGSGQTGMQLAEELHEAGRAVTLSVGHCGRVPRRYRDRDYFWWVRQLVHHGDGARDAAADRGAVRRPSDAVRLQPAPFGTRRRSRHEPAAVRGGRDTARRAGSMLPTGSVARFRPDLEENLAFADELFDQRFRPLFDAYASCCRPRLCHPTTAAVRIQRAGSDRARPRERGHLDRPLDDGLRARLRLARHARSSGSSASRSTTEASREVAGLTFIGLLWQRDNASANLAGVARDAEYLASRWEGRGSSSSSAIRGRDLAATSRHVSGSKPLRARSAYARSRR